MIGRIIRKVICFFYKILNHEFYSCVMYGLPKVYSRKKLIFGKKVHINDNIFINAIGGVIIGDYSIISHGVSIISTKNDIKNWPTRDKKVDIHINERIVIGKNVWLCANVTVCSGVEIADNCVVAAGSVVTNSLKEKNSLYGGVPAKFIKKL